MPEIPLFRRLSAVVGLMALGMLAACGDGPPASTDHRVLVRGNGGEPGTLDPILAEDIHAFNVLLDMYEGLFIEDAAGQLIPGVAESWRVSADGTTRVWLPASALTTMAVMSSA